MYALKSIFHKILNIGLTNDLISIRLILLYPPKEHLKRTSNGQRPPPNLIQTSVQSALLVQCSVRFFGVHPRCAFLEVVQPFKSIVKISCLLRHVGPGVGCGDGTKLQKHQGGDLYSGGQRVNDKDRGLKPGLSCRGMLTRDTAAPPTDLQRAAAAE